ncbi:T9SS type A sorting domain-containing protein [uncultured Aquimarina sp.]|uniref:T9SS type A sorting domain-containing protein n=1 Tax=uncultured Aquimarina sp. TaxID=575652 RepID=UPI002618E60F|nr:T9SS type A sorting domain-containing protein [uncultured Aquimarina sp.]
MKILTAFICFFFCAQLSAQRSKKPWSNPENYKEEVIESIKNSPQIIHPELYFNKNEYIHTDKNKMDINSKITSDSFVNGINIAWVNFGKDVGLDPDFQTQYHPDMEKFNEIMTAVSDAGGNVIRWWYHTNGSTNPVFDDDKKVTANPAFFYDDIKSILDLAASKDLKIQICLWSFDMLKDQWNVDAAANKKLLTEEIYFQSYIDNALLPLVNEIGDHPGLYAWEIFNEAEGMTVEYGNHWAGFIERVSIVDVQKFINKTAAAIRAEQPNVKITNGALGFLTSIDDQEKGYENLYSDEKLKEKGGEEKGYLDFYNIHYYNWAGMDGSPFHNEYNPEKLDKEAVIAEYYPDDTFGVSSVDMIISLMQNGWHGSLLWSWTDRSWDVMEPIIASATDYILSVEENDYNGVRIYPNPTKGVVNIIGLELESEVTIEIIDPTGKVVKKQLYSPATESIDISNVAKGVYYINFGNKLSKMILKL